MKVQQLMAAALCAAPGFALAQPYVAGKLGYASADFPLGAPYNGVIDDRSVMYGFDVGWGFTDRWAVEFGMSGYGDFEGRATPCPPGQVCALVIEPVEDNDVTVYRLSVVPRFEIGRWRLFAKAGYYRANVDTGIELANDDFRENGLLLGAGVRLYFRDPWHISLEASRLDDNVVQAAVGVGWGLRFGPD